MTTIASLATLNTSVKLEPSNAPLPVPTGSPASGTGESATASTLVTLQASSAESLTYARPTTLSTIWESASRDGITALMEQNFESGAIAGRFQGLGKALLERFASDGGNFSQSAMRPPLGKVMDASLTRLSQEVLHAVAGNQITLNVVTRSGANVTLTLGSDDDGGLAAQVNVTKGTLTDAERKALVSLADGFQQAIDGLTGDTLALNLGGLAQFDTKTLASVDLHASLKTASGKTQSFDFHADENRRSLSAKMITGSVNVSVDASKFSQLGSAAQQKQAMSAYLGQFDDARARGHGDETLMALFKDVFSQLLAVDSAGAPANPLITLSDTGRSMLTGLADFSASITEEAKSVNPMRLGEVDRFSYQVSQQTEIAGRKQTDYTVTQRQQSNLVASYHTTLSGTDGPLMLTGEAKSQNYRYYRIEDSASSEVRFSYSKGELAQAVLSRAASQSTHMTKYVLGKVTEDVTTPLKAASVLELLDTLTSIETEVQSDSERRRALDRIGRQVLLQADPSRLNASTEN